MVSFYYAPELGAAPARITDMAEGLHREGAEVDVLTCLPNYPKGEIFEGYKGCLSKHEVINGLNIYRYWTYATVSKSAAKRAVSMLSFAFMLWGMAFHPQRIKSYDYVIVQSPPLPVATSTILLFKKLFGKKVIVNVSDLWPLSAVELGAMREGSLIYKGFAAMERFIYRNADGILGQSQEIVTHISHFDSPIRRFVYRNLKQSPVNPQPIRKHTPLKIVYAGLLGVAQDILSIIQQVDFKSAHAEFHIYGGGNQMQAITQYIEVNKDCQVYYHGYVSKEELAKELMNYDASIVPLAVHIQGAVPSKIFDLVPLGIPILFCGGGEGAQIVERYGLGFSSTPGDFKALSENIHKIAGMQEKDFERISASCLAVAQKEFNFGNQMKALFDFIKSI